MGKKFAFITAVVLASFMGGAVSNWLLNVHCTPAEAQAPYRQPSATVYQQPNQSDRQFAQPQNSPVAAGQPSAGPQCAYAPGGSITTREIRFVDETGRVRGTLTMAGSNAHGRPRLVLLDEKDQPIDTMEGTGIHLLQQH